MGRIESIELHHIKMPLVYPFRTAFGDEDAIESVLVRISDGDDYGWGEACPMRFPAYCPEWAGGVFHVLRHILVPALLGHEIASGHELQTMLARFKGNHFAKSGLDTAWWDLQAKRVGKPLWKVLGGKNDVIDVGADFGIMESIDALLKTIDAAVNEGFKRIKLKYAPGWELDMVAAVRAGFPDTIFHVDCNSAYTLDDLSMLKKLDSYNLAMIEQPLMYDDLIDHATLQRQLETPVCLDESITSPAKARKAIAIGACRWINIKVSRVGGLTPALDIHRISEEEGVGCWVGGMLESGVGQSHSMALATLSNIRYPSDIFPSSRFYKKDLAVPKIVLAGPSQAKLPAAPGVGSEPDPDQLKQRTVASAVLRA